MKKFVALFIALVFTLSLTLSAFAAVDVRMLVPCYFYPSSQGSDWDRMIDMADDYGSDIMAIVNPNNGPGTSVNSDYTSVLTSFKNAGGYPLGYVHTSWGTRDIDDVKDDIDNWYTFYSPYGILLDEQSAAANTTYYYYYQEIYNYIKNKDQYAAVFSNAGTTTRSEYLWYDGQNTTDAIGIFENYTDYTNFENSSWTSSYSRYNFISLCYNVPNLSTAEDYIDNAVGDGYSGYIYCTDDNDGTIWDELPSYFEDMCSYCFD